MPMLLGSATLFNLAVCSCTSAVRQPIGRIKSLDRRKLDSSSDSSFYTSPRFVTHTDYAFILALTELYRERLPVRANVLDLMSSHVSHLPQERDDLRVSGHGMNAEELDANERLAAWTVQDLNIEPCLPFAPSASFDAILCCAGVQYLVEPERVFAECARALRPGGLLIVSFTDRFFFPKAIQGWIDRGMATRARLVKDYMRAAGGFHDDVEIIGSGTSILAQLGSLSGLGDDPFVAVVGTRTS